MRQQVNHDKGSKLDLYRFGYEMMLTAFKSDDIKTGVRNALFLTKMFTQSSDVLLYRKDNKTGEYDLYINALMIKHNRKNNVDWLREFINKGKNLFEGQGVKNIDCADISNDKDITLIPLTTSTHRYVLVIRNCNIYDVYKNKGFIEILNNNMDVMLKKLESISKAKKEGNKDKLTGLDSRNAYENDMREIFKNNEKFIYVLFDLFRLKYINDNYGYLMGDAYIIKTAEILKKYFSKYFTIKDTAGIPTKIPTGSCVYRLGGDEFILISKYETLDIIKAKLRDIEEEVANIELNTGEKNYLGINYGIAVKEGNESLKELATIADDEMKAHKAALYEKYSGHGIEQRKQLIKVSEE